MTKNPGNKPPSYSDLIKQVEAGDLNVDFKALRLAFLKEENGEAVASNAARAALRNALDAQCYPEARQRAEQMIRRGFVNIEAHAACARAHEALGNQQRAEFHRGVERALSRSILASGNGNSPQTAYQVIAVPEEYYAVRTLGFSRPITQELSDLYFGGEKHMFDVLTVSNRGLIRRIYFNVDAFFGKDSKSRV